MENEMNYIDKKHSSPCGFCGGYYEHSYNCETQLGTGIAEKMLYQQIRSEYENKLQISNDHIRYIQEQLNQEKQRREDAESIVKELSVYTNSNNVLYDVSIRAREHFEKYKGQ